MNTTFHPFKSPDGALITGDSIMAWFDNLSSDALEPILIEHGLHQEDIIAEEWYPAELFDQVHRKIMSRPGGSSSFVAVGKAMAEQLYYAEHIQSLHHYFNESLPAYMEAHFTNTPADFGLVIERRGTTHYRITNNTGMPNDLLYGFLWESSRLLRPVGSVFSVTPSPGFAENPEIGAYFDISWNM